MSRIFITGDTHGMLDVAKINEFDQKIGHTLTADDYLIIAGDFGGIWTGRYIRGSKFPHDYYARYEMLSFDDKPHKYWAKKPYTVLFIDGNHENHDALDMYPVKEWNGGKVHKIYENTMHLMRGQVFTIGGKTIFTMGGAESTDREWRQVGFSWWAREMPSAEEYEEAVKNLEAHGNKVDVILTHCAPEKTVADLKMPGFYVRAQNELTDFLDKIASTVTYDHWVFGHYHMDEDVGKFHLRYEWVDEIS